MNMHVDTTAPGGPRAAYRQTVHRIARHARIALVIAAIGAVTGPAAQGQVAPLAPQARSASASPWQTTASPHVPRTAYTATLLPSGKVLIAGGINWNGAVISGTELYDPASGTWRDAAPLGGIPAAARAGHTATLLQSGRVLVAGGGNDDAGIDTAELYDPATEELR